MGSYLLTALSHTFLIPVQPLHTTCNCLDRIGLQFALQLVMLENYHYLMYLLFK